MTDQPVTQWLHAWAGRDDKALEQLTPVVYEELRRIARHRFSGERAGHTLQPTALVNEAFAKLLDAPVDWQDRAHFFALSARMMRRILINHARSRDADKRGGGAVHVTLNESLADDGQDDGDAGIDDIDAALTALEARDPRKAQIIELSIFGGLTYKEMAEVTGLSSSTLDREMRFAKAWLKRYLTG